MSYREYYTNEDGEPMGFGTVYDDGPDPDEFYSRYDYQDETDPADYDDSEPERCEMDMKDGTVCQRVLSVDGFCGSEIEHREAEKAGEWQGGNDEWEETFTRAD